MPRCTAGRQIAIDRGGRPEALDEGLTRQQSSRSPPGPCAAKATPATRPRGLPQLPTQPLPAQAATTFSRSKSIPHKIRLTLSGGPLRSRPGHMKWSADKSPQHLAIVAEGAAFSEVGEHVPVRNSNRLLSGHACPSSRPRGVHASAEHPACLSDIRKYTHLVVRDLTRHGPIPSSPTFLRSPS